MNLYTILYIYIFGNSQILHTQLSDKYDTHISMLLPDHTYL